MSKLDKEQVIVAFTEAYTAKNGKAPSIEAKGGWYSVDGQKNVRLSDLNTLIDNLAAPSEAIIATESKEEPQKAAVKKAPAKKKVKTISSSFSVKTFWADKIKSQSSQTKLPR
jgi:hypothetical protein